MATIKDEAKRAGVAISTVSAVLNRSAPVSEDAIARVEAAVAAIGYMPHGAAQSLRSGRSRMIGLILPDITIGAAPSFSIALSEKAGSILTMIESGRTPRTGRNPLPLRQDAVRRIWTKW